MGIEWFLKNVGLGKFWPNIKISEAIVISFEVSFYSDYASWSRILKPGSHSLVKSQIYILRMFLKSLLHFLKRMPRHVFKILAKRRGTYNIMEGGHLIQGALIKVFFKQTVTLFLLNLY